VARSRHDEQRVAVDPSALDELLEAERAVASSLAEAEREAERLTSDAFAAAAAADADAERELAETLRLLDEQAAEQRERDARAIRQAADRRTRSFAGADDARVAAIAERLALFVAPAAESK
jgi:vacuolar-type H+-ATPase subunit H